MATILWGYVWASEHLLTGRQALLPTVVMRKAAADALQRSSRRKMSGELPSNLKIQPFSVM